MVGPTAIEALAAEIAASFIELAISATPTTDSGHVP
jgi:hypothetical protein